MRWWWTVLCVLFLSRACEPEFLVTLPSGDRSSFQIEELSFFNEMFSLLYFVLSLQDLMCILLTSHPLWTGCVSGARQTPAQPRTGPSSAHQAPRALLRPLPRRPCSGRNTPQRCAPSQVSPGPMLSRSPERPSTRDPHTQPVRSSSDPCEPRLGGCQPPPGFSLLRPCLYLGVSLLSP